MDGSDEHLSIDEIVNTAGDLDSEFIANEAALEDLTGENGQFSDQSSLASLTVGGDGAVHIKPRAYQVEMLNESLDKNIIVAMDTGSGKTHCAVLRMKHELEHIAEHQFIWFLATTVTLCSQQYEYFKSQITAVQIKFLSGADGVDRWTEQSLWNSVLKNVKIVVSTYQILLDALTHGFVRIDSLKLIVFDEAHNCVGKHHGSKIMHQFYHPQKQKGLKVPYILGLTASPVMGLRSDPASLGRIEATLDAICRTPTKHREELRLQVKLPKLTQITYQTPPSMELLTGFTTSIASLGKVFLNLKIEEDPYVLQLQKQSSEKSASRLQKVFSNHKTWCQDQMKSFRATSLKIAADLGSWAADHYISTVVTKFLGDARKQDEFWSDWNLSYAERLYLTKCLRSVELNGSINDNPAAVMVSDKVSKLIAALLEQPPGCAGIIFVQERAVVAVLAKLLSIHPKTRGHFSIGTIVGTSTSSHRNYDMGELTEVGSQKHTLALFKSGIINLIIATSVLEEGIDVPACNLVICFQKPANLKSFVQRRGRARQRDSRLILLLDSETDKVSELEQLELTMKALYEDEMRELQELLVLEDTEVQESREFRVPSTGALLDLDNAVQHLFHFCATLPSSDRYVDLRPDFICLKSGSSLVRAKVILPLSVHAAVRTAESKRPWKSERNAMKDAAFEAYLALYNAGLVNANLLPLLRHDPVVDELTNTAVETHASLLMVSEQLNPWINVAKSWKEYAREITCSTISMNGLEMRVFLPKMPAVAPFQVYWDSKTTFRVTVQAGSDAPTATTTTADLSKAVGDTQSLLEASFGSRFPIQQQQHHVALFSPRASNPLKHRPDHDERFESGQPSPDVGLVKDVRCKDVAYIFRDTLPAKPSKEEVQHPYEEYDDHPPDAPHLSLTRLPRRLDFLHEIPPGKEVPSGKLFSVVLPVSRCTVDLMPFKYVQFGLLIPCIMRRVEIYLLADELSTTILRDVGICDLDLVATAISASSAGESSNYQRLEFIGDSVLKLCTSVQLTDEYPLWHEGYLSSMKDRLVSNARLSRAAIDSGLDKFIVKKAFNGQRWRPLYVEDLVGRPEGPQRELSSKVLADVVEALIGAAMVDGGFTKALKCLRVFLPELNWQPLETRQVSLHERASDGVELPTTLRPLENLIGYRFRKKSLLIESMTHASRNAGSGSLERFEFLGDSILDWLVVHALERHEPELSHVEMHLLRTALVNADFLAFLCMEWAVDQEGTDIVTLVGGGDDTTAAAAVVENKVAFHLPLWKFMRHHSAPLGTFQAVIARRHVELRHEISTAIQTGDLYPWALLSRLQATKFYSDLVESLIGAIWVDSGSFDVCRDVVERMGILPYMRRILRDRVHLWHPKEELGQLSITETVKYTIGLMEKSAEELGGGDKRYWCKIFIGGKEVVEVRDGVSKEEVKTKAAEVAVKVMKARRSGREDGDMDVDVSDAKLDVEMVMN